MRIAVEPDTRSAEQKPGVEDSLRIALLNPRYWPEVRRGAERMAHDLGSGLLANGHRVRLITSHRRRPSRTHEDGMEVQRLWRPSDARLRRRLYDDQLTHAPLSYLALSVGRDDVAHALSVPDAVVAGVWRRRTGGVAVLSYMGIPTRRFLVARRLRIETTVAACRTCDAVTALSQAAADAFSEVLGVRARVINPGVDVNAFTPGGARAEVPTIFCNASLEIAYKRVDMLLRALARVRRSRPETRLLMPRPRDQRLAERVQRECEGVDLLSLEAGDPDALLLEANRRAWVAALPSRGEAFGLVLLEALACGTPVVGAADGGVPDVLDRPDIGRLFDGDEHALCTALLEAIELAEQPGTAAACRERATELSSARSASAFEVLYRELLEQRDSA